MVLVIVFKRYYDNDPPITSIPWLSFLNPGYASTEMIAKPQNSR